MIRKIINKLLGKSDSSDSSDSSGGSLSLRKPRFGKRVEVPVSVHGIHPELVLPSAVQVIRTLKAAGFEAYIVGGAVRDLLLGLRPKDFDVATNAAPEEVKRLFHRAFIIGRRFRIVHVVFGRGREHEVIEVSTFRAYLDGNAAAAQVKGNERTAHAKLEHMQHAVDPSGRVLRDNVWGPQNEDATRRDFTINAMYYDPETQILVDYHKGMQDAQKRILRMIGDPCARYREDPVRIIRAVRFVAKLAHLGFTLEAKTAKPLQASQSLLGEVPQSRLFDEMLKLLQTGHALASIEQLQRLGLARGIYPLLDVVVQRTQQHPLVQAALQDTDRRIAEGKNVAPSFLLACVLWQDVQDSWQRYMDQGEHELPALQQAIDEVFDLRIGDVSGRGKLAADMREIWLMQPRFDKRSGSQPYSMVAHLRFRAGFDFFRLRAEVGQVSEELVEWWQEFSLTDESRRSDMLDQVREELRQRQRQKQLAARSATRSKPSHSSNPSNPSNPSNELPLSAEEAAAPQKKRRRRRRKPSSGGGGAGGDGSASGGGSGGDAS